MIKRIQLYFLLLLFIISPQLAQASDSTRVFTQTHPLVYEDAWDLWPYSFLNANGEAVGYNIDLLDLICKELEIPYVVNLKPTIKALNDLKNGEADLMLAMAADYHDEYGLYGKSVVQIFTHSVLHRKAEPLHIKKESDLAHHKVIVHEGSYSHHLMQEKGWGDKAIPYNDMREAVQYIHDTPGQQIVWNTLSLKWLQRTLHFDDLQLSPVKMPHGHYKFMSNNSDLLNKIDSVYTILESEGKLQGIQNKWFYPERKDSGIPFWIWQLAGALFILLLIGIGYYVFYRIRESKMTKTFRRSNNRLSLILKTSHVRVWLFNVEKKTVTVFNENGEVEAEDQPPTIFFQRMVAEDVQRISSALLSIVEGQHEKVSLEVCSEDKESGERRTLAIVLSILHCDRYGHPTDIIGTTSDVTENRRRQEQIKRVMLRYQSIFSSAMVDTITYDALGYMADMNEKAAKAFPGGLEGALKNHVHLRDVIGENVSLETMQPIYMTRLYDVDSDSRVFNKDIHHRKMYYELQLMPLRDERGKMKAIFGTGRDVSELVKSYLRLQHNLALQEQANEEMNNYFRNINFVLQNGGVRMAKYSPDTHTLLIYSSLGQEQNQLTQTRALALTDDGYKKLAQRVINSMDNRVHSPLKATIKTILRVKGGKRLTLLLSFIPTEDEQGRVVEYFGVCRDISEIKATEEKLAEESAKAQEVESVKNAFLRNMSYEIRTPLSSVVGFAELFEQEHASEDEGLFIEQIKNNSALLLKLINNILFLSRLDAGMINLNVHPVDFSKFFEARCETAWANRQEEGVEYVIDNRYAQMTVEIDDQNLGHVIDEIVVNAATHTHEGMVRCSYEYTGEDLVMAFQDTGSGISKERLSQIFERFASIGSHGTGLGLSICHDMVKLMGGKIKIKSEEGKGTIVWVTIPCKCTEIIRK